MAPLGRLKLRADTNLFLEKLVGILKEEMRLLELETCTYANLFLGRQVGTWPRFRDLSEWGF